MTKRMLIDALHTEETRVVIASENQIYDFDFSSAAKKQLKGNIYLAKITRVEPSLQAAFVEYGGGKQGFLPFSEIHADYYQIPVSDRKRLMQEVSDDPTSDAEPESQQPDDNADHDANEPQPIEAAGEGAPQEQPAYLTQGAIETSSEEIGLPELPEQIEAREHTETADAAEPADTHAAPAESNEAPAEAKSEVETLPNEEEEYSNQRKKNQFFKRYRIQEVIRRGQIVLVQVIKEERGNKGVSLTTYLSLAGRYCVLMPNSPKDGGISRKIASGEDRKRLKAISTELKLAAGMSVIIRTAGMDRTRAEIKRDYDYLVKVWNRTREDTLKSTAPALIYEESDVIKRAIRDQYASDIDEILVEGDEGYKTARDFMKLLLPSHTPKIKHYKEATPLFYAYNIEDQLLSMHDPVVKLRSGGYIVINPTEALISIDVNSGRATGERNIEETATKTNLEAAAEVARQLRLRDLAGLIVIDFIDMLESRNRRNVERALKDSLKADRAKIQIGRISPFGLLEMSRQRLRSSISETNMVQCPHCIGRGYVRSNESMSIQLIRVLEKEASTGSWSGLRLLAPQAVALHLLNTKRDILRGIEERHDISVQVLVDPALATSEFNLEKMRRSGDQRRRKPQSRASEIPVMEEAPIEEEIVVEEEISEETPRESSSASNDNRQERGGRRGRRGRRGGRGRHDRPERPQAAEETAGAEAPAESAQPPEENKDQPPYDRPRGNRGGRGGRGRRRWRDQPSPEQNRSGFDPASRGGRGERPNRENRPADTGTDGQSLPAFATEDRLPVEPPAPRVHEHATAAPPESTPRDPNAPPKKGWWKKMIELDD